MLTPAWSGRFLTGRWLLLAMLLVLHLAMSLGVHSPWVHPLLIAHLGLFLIWQPLWHGASKVSGTALAIIVLAAFAALFWLNWWVVALWLTGLFGLVGARVLAFRDLWSRGFSLLVMAYLLAALLLWVVPNLFMAESTIEVGRTLMRYVLPLLLLVMALLPTREERVDGVQSVDFIYSLVLFLLLALVVLGSLAFMTLGQMDYLAALLRTLFLIGLLLLSLGGLWRPRFGYSGLQIMFSRYLLNLGTPFESWLSRLADAAQREPDAARYLTRATTLLAELPWLSGLSWQAPTGSGQSGQFSEYGVMVQEGDLRLTLYAKRALNPTVSLHIHLLTQLIGYFYQAKQREQTLRDITHLRAVYETGSRLTHDLKNMLQSLFSLTALAQSESAQGQQLLRQQLPLLAQRIELVMTKLQQPQSDNDSARLALGAWWQSVQARNQHQKIIWRAPPQLPEIAIPQALFDCVADNLIENALRKRQSEPDIRIIVVLTAHPAGLTVCDSGTAIPAEIAAKLLGEVVASEGGLGIGLFQAARWAEQLDYRLSLGSNVAGEVSFELRQR
ncbi:MAG: sensor histidine kinase [Pseudomonadota bacterium]